MATLTTLVSFTGGVDGANPGYGSLIADANGDLFGTTVGGGATGDGTAFELINTGSGYVFQSLASLTYGSTGSSPFAGLTMDANGDLFGVAQAGGASGLGTVFELVNTGSGYAMQTLANFTGTNGSYPMGGLVADANGDLFGATQNGGANGDGTVFELVKTGSGYGLQTLATFNFSNGASPDGQMLIDSHGDLFGTTSQGGAGNVGTVFELVNSGSGYSLQTIATFDGTNGSYLHGGLVADGQGDLFGTTYSGGAGGYGTVFELVNTGSGYTQQTLATFDFGAMGGLLIAGLSIDAQGDLYGAAMAGGAGGFGTVFELVHSGAGYSFQTLYAFTGASDGGMPESAPIVDASGALYGTTAGGGAYGSGAVYEFSVGATAPSDDDSAEQAALGLTVNNGSATPIGAAGVSHVGFSVAGLESEDTGVVTFTDQANHVVMVQVTAGQTAYVVDLSSLTDGTISASLQVAIDPAGNSFSPVAGNAVTLDTTPPSQPGEPADASAHNGWVNAANDTAGQTIGGTTEAGATVAVYDNGTQVATVTADNAGAWSWQVGVLADGSSHSYAVTATDAAGNTSAMSEPLNFTVDTTPPPAPTGLADAAIAGGYVNGANDTAFQTLTGSAEAGAVVTVYDNGAKLGTATADAATGAWSFSLGVLADGAQILTATATDAAGNTGAASASLAFTVDTVAPTPVVDNVTGGAKGLSIVSGTSEAGSTVTLLDGGQKVGVATAGADGAWSVTLKLAGASVHVFTETALDQAGNPGASTGAAYWANPANQNLVGAAGNDVFVGQKGDSLTGGSGQDHFVFNPGFGREAITNFASGSDGIWFDHTLFGSASQVLAAAHQSGANTVIADATGDQLVLQNVLATALQAGDFHFF